MATIRVIMVTVRNVVTKQPDATDHEVLVSDIAGNHVSTSQRAPASNEKVSFNFVFFI